MPDMPAKGKGKTKETDTNKAPCPPAMPVLSMDPPWLAVANHTAPAPAAAASSAADLREAREDSAKDRQIRALVNAMKKHTEALPEELQTMLQDVNLKASQQETKLLHSAVATHGRAKKELQEAQIARANLHASWRKFLTQSAQQWQQYSDMFLQQEKDVSERVTQAREALASARETLSNSKKAAGVEAKEDANTMSDTEEIDISANTATKITEGFNQLSAGLQTLQQQAQMAEEEEQKAMKRQRLEAPAPTESPGSTTNVPFGGPA